MDRLVHTALTAMQGHMARQGTIANNLANVSTTGFRADLSVTQGRLVVSAGAAGSARVLPAHGIVGLDRQAGAVEATGRALDISLGGTAMLAVMPRDGAEAYTRRGDLMVLPGGTLATGDGHVVAGLDGPITLAAAGDIAIAADGTVTQADPGAGDAPPRIAGRLKLVTTDGLPLAKRTDGLIAPAAGGTLPADADATLTPGTLERSNVSATTALVDMIAAARAYEVGVKLVTTAQTIDEAGTRLMSLPS